MISLSPEFEQELARRLTAGPYLSAEDLLRQALQALDGTANSHDAWLEGEILKGFEGDKVEMNAEDWASIEAEGVRVLNSRKPS